MELRDPTFWSSACVLEVAEKKNNMNLILPLLSMN